MTFAELNPALDAIARRAKNDGAEAEVLMTRDESFSVSMKKGALDKFDSGLSLCAGLRVIKDGSVGYCSTENLSEAALLEAYKEALGNAELAARFSGASDADLKLIESGANGLVETLDERWHRPRDVEAGLDVARRIEDASLKADPRIVAVPYNGYRESTSSVRVFNTKGVDCSWERGAMAAYAYALATSGEESRTAGESFVSRAGEGLDPAEIGSTAARKALAKLGSGRPPTGSFPVLFETEPTAELLGILTDYLSGKTVLEKRSLFGESLDQAIAGSVLTMTDEPILAEGLASRPFDSEGTPSRRLTLVENGVLKAFLTNSVIARKLGRPNTGHAARGPRTELGIAPSNVVVRPGHHSREELLTSAPRVIVINDLAGFHAGFNHGSGEFSLQAEGELWENGVRVRPLANFVLSGDYKQFLRGIEAVARDVPRPRSSIITPEILVRGLSIVGDA